jgi:hypothetical protein
MTMLGWLAHAFASARCSTDGASCSISRCAVPMTGRELAARLPLLGGVLYLPARPPIHRELPVPSGWLVTRPELAPLLHTRELVVASMIGADGPREWIDCLDARSQFCARLHLLPDTDYLAWDALLAQGRALPSAPMQPARMACRAASAELVCFGTRHIGGLDVLDATPLGRLSALGCGIAREAARAAAVELEPFLG